MEVSCWEALGFRSSPRRSVAIGPLVMEAGGEGGE